MTLKRTWTALLLLALLPAALSAQERKGRGWLGISFGWEREGAREARVDEVAPGSAAARAGIRQGDVVVRIDEEPATEETVDELREGDRVRLVLRRGAEEMRRDVTAAPRPNEDVLVLRGGERVPLDVNVERIIINDTLRKHMEELVVRMDSLRQRIRVIETDSGGERRIRVLGPEGEIVTVNTDSVAKHVEGMMRRFRVEGGEDGRVRVFGIGPDSVVVIHTDSILRGVFSDSMRVHFEREFRELPRGFPVQPWMELDELDDLDPEVPFFMELGRRAVAGAELAEMNEGLGRYFRTDEGVLVLRVGPGTVADRAGLEAGDVIVEVNDQEVESVRDLHGALTRGEGKARIQILREGRRRTLEADWPRERMRAPSPGNTFYYFGPEGERRRVVEKEIEIRREESDARREEVRELREESRERREEVRKRQEEARERARRERGNGSTE